ncbi:MAG TPA: phosphoribosyltransferase family protein [bacterium]|nr:phosphoribosyltransferase family protein [bacterium]
MGWYLYLRARILLMNESPQTIVFTRSQIQSAVAGVSQEVAAWLQSKHSKSLHLISVMEGAKPFARDLVANLGKILPALEVKVHEIRIKGTDGKSLLETREWQGSGLDPAALDSAPVLLVDDLVDSGKTLQMLKEKVLALGVLEVKTAVLTRKFGDASGPVDFVGFDLNLDHEALAQKGSKDYWLFGYGMDLAGQYRDLDYVGWVEIKI